MNIGFHREFEAFDEFPIGQKILDKERFLVLLEQAIRKHDSSGDENPGFMIVRMDDEAKTIVSSGWGHRSANPEDYILREHCGRVGVYLRREKAVEAEFVDVRVFEIATYVLCSDAKDAKFVAELDRLTKNGVTHVVTGISTSTEETLRRRCTPYFFLSMLALYLNACPEDVLGLAKLIFEEDKAWSSVADPLPLEVKELEKPKNAED